MHNTSHLLIPLHLAAFKAYEMEDDSTKDLVEFSLANAIYAALVESHAAEISSRYVPICIHRPPLNQFCYTVATPWTMRPRTPEK
jgi:hypothetical protein